MKKHTLLIVLLLVCAGVMPARTLGVGFILGQPTGLSFKVPTGGGHAIDGGLSWSDGDGDASTFHVHVDYLFQKRNVIALEKGPGIHLHYGFGLRLRDHADTHCGLRFPVGLNYTFARTPIEIFFEFAPVFDLAPATRLDANAGVGVRFYL